MNPFKSDQLRSWKYEKFKLKCGHLGNIIWRSNDGETIAVRGTMRYCRDCGKKGKGEWTPTVYIISKPEADDKKRSVAASTSTSGEKT